MKHSLWNASSDVAITSPKPCFKTTRSALLLLVFPVLTFLSRDVLFFLAKYLFSSPSRLRVSSQTLVPFSTFPSSSSKTLEIFQQRPPISTPDLHSVLHFAGIRASSSQRCEPFTKTGSALSARPCGGSSSGLPERAGIGLPAALLLPSLRPLAGRPTSTGSSRQQMRSKTRIQTSLEYVNFSHKFLHLSTRNDIGKAVMIFVV